MINEFRIEIMSPFDILDTRFCGRLMNDLYPSTVILGLVNFDTPL